MLGAKKQRGRVRSQRVILAVSMALTVAEIAHQMALDPR